VIDRLQKSQATTQEMERIDYAYVAETVPRCLVESRQGVEHIAHVVSVMREFARAGEQQPSRQALNELIRTAVDVTRGQWHQVAELELQLEETLPAIDCVAITIKQVVLCAVMNAVRALARGVNAGDKGVLRIRTFRDPAGWVTLEISDNGRGIDSELVQRVLSPALGQRLCDNAAQGLAYARHVIVERHRGQLEMSSSASGTTLSIRLPLPEGMARN
jgi:two-component system, NtrC family, sensor kinase